MQPKGYLAFIAKKWDLITELFEINKDGPIDQATLLQAIGMYHPETDPSSLIEALLSYDVLSRLFSNQTLYNLGDLIEQIVEHLLNEQQLGLSESILIHMDQFDSLSFSLLEAAEKRDSDELFRTIKKINRQIQAVKRQTLHNYKAIQNIVAESKKRDSAIPIKQRYADILDAWDQYITPIGEMIDPWGMFDPNTDKVINRLEKAVDTLEKVGALRTEPENIHIAKQMIIDMRVNTIESFKMSRELLQPLYEIARLNSMVTRGTSIVLDYLRKDKFKEIENIATLSWFFKERSPLLSHDSGLLKYYAGYKNIKDNPAPPILIRSEKDKEENIPTIKPPLDRYSIIKEIRSDLPIEDAMQWAIEKHPDFPTGKILDIILLMITEKTFCVRKCQMQDYRTQTHLINGFSLKVENEQH